MRYTTCPKCSALVEPKEKRCPYCATDLRHKRAPTPASAAEDTTQLGKIVIAINVVIFLAALMLDPTRGDRDGFSLTLSPFARWMFGAGSQVLLLHCGQWWRLATAMFLHLDLMHIVFNSIALLYVTPPAAHTFGPSRSIAIYLVAGLLSNLIAFLIPGQGGAGASGAVSGMIGALLVWGWRRGGPAGDALRRSMTIWIVYIFAFGLVLSSAGVPIGHLAHAAGIAVGAGLGWLASAVATPSADRIWQRVGQAVATLVVGLFVLGFLPFVYGVFQRDAVHDSYRDVKSVLKRIDAVRAGQATPASLPKTSPSVPGATGERLRGSMNGVLEAWRAGDVALARKRYVVLQAARDAWATELACRYGIEK